MTLLALLALVASVLIWAAPSSQAQANQAPFADAGTDATVNPGADVTLSGADSVDVDDDNDASTACTGCEYEWEVEAGPYDWIQIGESDTVANDDTATSGAFFEVPSEAFVDKVADSDPQKYEIVVRLTVTDNDGATDSDTVSININQRPVADIQVYAGLRDEDIVDADLGAQGHFPLDAVIDGPGENGNRDNEWDIMEGAYLQLDGSGSTDENPLTGRPASYWWTRPQLRGAADDDGYALDTDQTSPGNAAQQRLAVAVDNGETGDDSNVTTITFVGVDANDDNSDDTLVVPTLPDVLPNAPVTVFYQLNVCDAVNSAGDACDGRTGATLIRIVVHDTSATPEVSIDAGLTNASTARGDAEPQETVGDITGVENQFIVGAGSTVLLTATVEDDDQATGHNFRWSGATAIPTTSTATVRVPADADDGDTIEGSVTVTDATRISVTATFQLLVGENTPPTAGGVPSNGTGIPGVINRSSYTDGIQNLEDGATITLRGVGNDADGDSLIHAWVLRETPDDFGTLMATALEAIGSITDSPGTAAYLQAFGTALAPLGLRDLEEPENPLVELSGAFTDTVSFDAPELENGETKGFVLLFTVIDSMGVAAAQMTYIEITGDDDVPNADAGDDEQVDPEAFVRLNGSGSADPDVGDTITYSWEFTGATMDPAPDERSPLSDDEIDELEGWILEKTDDGFAYIVNSAGVLTGSSDKLQGATTAYPYFDAPDLTGFNNIKLTFTLTVTDSADNPADEINGAPLGDSESDDGAAEYDTDTVTITVVNRYFSGNIPGPDHCTGLSLGGPQTYPFDSDGDGVADTCSLNTTRRGTVARQNALETLANLNPGDFRTAVLAVCGAPGFKQRNYGDDPADLDSDVCETERVTPPPIEVDPADADVFYSGTITGPDFCTNYSLGGARTYGYDSDDDGVADTCSLSTTRREAIARQNGLNSFIVSLTAIDTARLAALTAGDDADVDTADDVGEQVAAAQAKAAADRSDDENALLTELSNLQTKQSRADRYSNAVDAACRALGTQDFGDAASALARDACAPKSGPTGTPLS